MTEIAEQEAYLVPAVGTVVSLQNPTQVATALSDVRELESHLREAKGILTRALVEESKRRGSKTLDLGWTVAEIRGGMETVWDTEALSDGLLALGCPQELVDEIVKTEITYKVDARRTARAATANPDYAGVISSARTEIEKPHTVVLRKP